MMKFYQNTHTHTHIYIYIYIYIYSVNLKIFFSEIIKLMFSFYNDSSFVLKIILLIYHHLYLKTEIFGFKM